MNTYNLGVFNRNKPTPQPEPEPMVWEPCSTCWGQGRVYQPVTKEQLTNAEEHGGKEFAAKFRNKMWQSECPTCIGLGQTIGGNVKRALS